MKPVYFAVARKDGDWEWVTFFYRAGHMCFTYPKVIEGIRNGINYRFKRLTEAQYETYLEMEVLEYRDSENFALPGQSDELIAEFQRAQAAHELHELDDVFDQSK